MLNNSLLHSTACIHQRELSSKVQRIDALQGELNSTQADKAAAEAAATEAKDQASQLQSSLEQVNRQVAMMSSSKDAELQQLHAELAAAVNAKAGLEMKVRCVLGKEARHTLS